MIIINEAKRVAFRRIFHNKVNLYRFAQSGKKGSDKKNEGLNEDSLGSYRGLIYNMRKDAQVAHKNRIQQNAVFKYAKKVQEHLVELTLYMQHNNWKSQFIYLLLNYNKLGFKIVSDYAFLDSSSYMLQLRNIKEEDRWPTIRAIIGLKPRIIVTGAEQIEKFFLQNMYFQQSVFKEAQQYESTKKFIDEEILPSMQSLLWHPTLTYQTTFHTDHYYHQSQQKNYMLVEILLRNFGSCGKAMLKNSLKIMKEKQRYLQSKDKFTNGLKEISQLYLKKGEYFGGQKPNFIDFYLFSHLKTKWGSRYFKNYIQDQISDEFKRWLLRMGWNCEYSRDRVTVL